MSSTPILSLHPLTRVAIEAQGVSETEPNRTYRCGCHHRGIDKMWLCPYHEGYDAGIDAINSEICGQS